MVLLQVMKKVGIVDVVVAAEVEDGEASAEVDEAEEETVMKIMKPVRRIIMSRSPRSSTDPKK